MRLTPSSDHSLICDVAQARCHLHFLLQICPSLRLMCRLLVEMLMPLLATGLYSKHGGATVQNAVYVTSAPQLSNHPMTVEVLGGGFSFNPDLDSHVLGAVVFDQRAVPEHQKLLTCLNSLSGTVMLASLQVDDSKPGIWHAKVMQRSTRGSHCCKRACMDEESSGATMPMSTLPRLSCSGPHGGDTCHNQFCASTRCAR